jgi:hypothetical protein
VGLLVSLIAGLVIWLVLWAIGVKSFDAFLLTIGVVLIAVTVRIISPFLPGNRPDEPPGGGYRPL